MGVAASHAVVSYLGRPTFLSRKGKEFLPVRPQRSLSHSPLRVARGRIRKPSPRLTALHSSSRSRRRWFGTTCSQRRGLLSRQGRDRTCLLLPNFRTSSTPGTEVLRSSQQRPFSGRFAWFSRVRKNRQHHSGGSYRA